MSDVISMEGFSCFFLARREWHDDERQIKENSERRENERKRETRIRTKHIDDDSHSYFLVNFLNNQKNKKMNGSLFPFNSIHHIDRLLSIYSLLLIIIGTPANLLCCIIYFQRNNRSNSIKILFGYLAFFDAIVPYTFNLNYVFREFYIHLRVSYSNESHWRENQSYPQQFSPSLTSYQIQATIVKKNVEEYSVFLCRFLSYLGKICSKDIFHLIMFVLSAFSTLQTSSWVLAFGSLNRYLLIKKLRHVEFICKRQYTITICLLLTLIIFLSNMHILWMNGYRSTTGAIECYKNEYFPNYMIWYQRLHLFIYSVVPSLILFVFNVLLMRIIFASKKRLDNHKRLVLFAATATTTIPNNRRRSFLALQQNSVSALRRINKNSPSRILHRHSRKLTISLIFIAISFFVLTIPSTVIFSFVRPHIQSSSLRRTLSLFLTNLATTTHVIRFFIYFFCSIDFRNDFYRLFFFQRSLRLKWIQKHKNQQEHYPNAIRWKTRTTFIDGTSKEKT